MSRNLVIASVLFAVAVVATVWALRPGCEGRFCFASASKTGAGQEQAGAVPGTGRQVEAGSEAETVPEAQSAGSSGTGFAAEQAAEPPAEQAEEAGVAEQPSEPLQDQQATAAARAAGEISSDGTVQGYGDEPELTPAQRRAQEAAKVEAAKRWDSLVEAALNEPDDELRGEAINSVGLHRSAESVAVLNEVATLDPSPDNRLQAVQQLWYSAADGLDPDGEIEATLRAALDDPDEAIAEMAEKALADLEALEKSRQAQ